MFTLALTRVYTQPFAAERIGTVYASSKTVEANTNVAFSRMNDESLKTLGELKSGDKGTGDMDVFDGGYEPAARCQSQGRRHH